MSGKPLLELGEILLTIAMSGGGHSGGGMHIVQPKMKVIEDEPGPQWDVFHEESALPATSFDWPYWTVLAPYGLVLSCGWLYTHLHVEIKFPVSGCESLCAGCCSVRKFGFRR